MRASALVARGGARRAILLLAALGACSGPPAPPPLVAREIGSPAAPGSGEANLAVAPDGAFVLSWIEPAGEGRHALRFARLEGGAWSAPRTIASGEGWFVNWADFPALAFVPDGTVFAHWLAKTGPSTYAYAVQVVRSHDGGATWSAPVVPHRDGTPTEHGFVSMTPWSEADLGVVWLDGRKTAKAAPSDHGHTAAEMALVHTTVGRDGSLGPETVLDGRVCDCCQTDMARAGDAVVVVYRDRSEKEIRDISAVRFAGGRWSAPRAVAADGWEINGCPVNGPAVAAEGNTAAVAWVTAAGDRPWVKLAFSEDAGQTFGAPIVVDGGRPLGRVDVVMVDARTALVSWLAQGEGGTASLHVGRFTREGARGDAATVAVSSGARSSGFPRIARSGDRAVIAWRDAADPPRVRTAVLDAAAGR